MTRGSAPSPCSRGQGLVGPRNEGPCLSRSQPSHQPGGPQTRSRQGSDVRPHCQPRSGPGRWLAQSSSSLASLVRVAVTAAGHWDPEGCHLRNAPSGPAGAARGPASPEPGSPSPIRALAHTGQAPPAPCTPFSPRKAATQRRGVTWPHFRNRCLPRTGSTGPNHKGLAEAGVRRGHEAQRSGSPAGLRISLSGAPQATPATAHTAHTALLPGQTSAPRITPEAQEATQ